VKRVAFVFPGQGSQYVGMGETLIEQYPEIEMVLDEAGALIGVDLKRLCLEGPEEELTRTSNAQPALLALSSAVFAVVSRHLTPSIVAGHSLGEYSALVACGSIRFEDAVRLVRKRGELMETAADGTGTMCAVLGLELGQVEEACHKASHIGVVVPANINCPGQVVISGDRAAVEAAALEAQSLGAKRTTMLKVSGAFHSPLMEKPARLFEQYLEEVSILDAKIPVVSNVTGEAVQSGSEIRRLLLQQLTSAVRFDACVSTLLAAGVEAFVELGAGRVISGLVRRIDRSVPVYTTDSSDDMEDLLQFAREE
jgi:[acyl-carrier-protein] S-malonyltransferase